MTNDPRETGKPDDRPSDEAAFSARLRHLGDQLGTHQPSPGALRYFFTWWFAATHAIDVFTSYSAWCASFIA